MCEEGHDRAALTKSAEQMMHALAAYTRDGMVFPVDPRLRPRGGEGELLVTPKQLEVYFAQEAQAWEALMYTKLRFLVGSRRVGERASAAVKGLFQRFAADSNFLAAVREMRARLETGEKSFKTSPGGAYDIDFIASYLLIKHGLRDTGGSLRDRLWRCAEAGILSKTDTGRLDHAAELLRTLEHVVRLVVGRTRKWLPGTEHARQVTAELTARILKTEFTHGLEADLQRNMQEVREIFQRVLG
jgi:glutamate-ammonia-ligase adenylyltransferase